MRVLAFLAAFTLAHGNNTSGVEDKFLEFKKRFGKVYQSAEHEEERFNIFVTNLQKIEQSNMKNHAFKLGLTPFTDMTYEEFRAKHVPGVLCEHHEAFEGFPNLGAHVVENVTQPASVDWVAERAVSDVLQQGGCGSCWAFSATGALESATFIAKGKKSDLTKLSQQNLLDCIPKPSAKCFGGTMNGAFDYVRESGICSADDYPYMCADPHSKACTESKCRNDCKPLLGPGSGLHVTGHITVPNSEAKLESAVARQPVSIGIEAASVFQHYTGGVLTSDECGEQLDHGVLIVGYGVDAGTKYWKVKNSWGPEWGENGYIRIQKGKGTSPSGGECGIRKMASYPVISHNEDMIVV